MLTEGYYGTSYRVTVTVVVVGHGGGGILILFHLIRISHDGRGRCEWEDQSYQQGCNSPHLQRAGE